MRLLGHGVVFAALISFAGCSDGVAGSDNGTTLAECDSPERLADLPAELAEASGIARDPRRPDLFWIHNDSDNDPVLFGVDTAGSVQASATVVSASVRDPEDLAVARCDESWCLFYGDIGDNGAVRQDLFVHRLPLPTVPAEGAGPAPVEVVTPLATYRVRYPEGPRDAEALVIDADRGELLIITKGREEVIEMYAADLATLESVDGPVALTRIGRLAVTVETSSQFVTAADVSPDGSRLAVRAYATLYLFDWSGTAAFDTLTAPFAVSLAPALEPQGEGIAFDGSGERLYLASEGREGRPPQLSRLACRL
jgi:hypothetical protein